MKLLTDRINAAIASTPDVAKARIFDGRDNEASKQQAYARFAGQPVHIVCVS